MIFVRALKIKSLIFCSPTMHIVLKHFTLENSQRFYLSDVETKSFHILDP